MTSRLRSEKGSFVRSPLGAFETEGAPVVAGAVNVALATAQYARMPALSPAPAECLIQLGSPGQRDVFTFSFLAGSIWTDDQLAYGTYTGVTSGVSWSPGDWSVLYHCDYLSDALPRVYVGGGVIDVFGDGTAWSHEFYAETEAEDDPQSMRATYNVGQFPGQTMPAFQNAENFTFTPGSPP